MVIEVEELHPVVELGVELVGSLVLEDGADLVEAEAPPVPSTDRDIP